MLTHKIKNLKLYLDIFNPVKIKFPILEILNLFYITRHKIYIIKLKIFKK